jgi:hypothetical protein
MADVNDDQVRVDVAAHLRMLLGEIVAGELSCSAAMRHRIEGAALALDPVTAGQTVAQTGQRANGAP